MTLIAWNAYFETGLEEVDKQHHYLVDLVNEVAPVLAAADGAIPANIDDLFRQLLVYAAEHFATEERLMRARGLDPRHIDHHIGSHCRFVDSVNQLAADYLDQRDVSGRHLLGFVANWLVFHILGEDQAMARQLRRIEAGMSAVDAHDANGGSDINPAQQALTHALVDMYALLTEQNRELAARREADVRHLNDRYKIVADYTVDWESWIDTEGRYLYCSPACERLTGYPAQTFIDDPGLLARIVHPDDVAAVNEHFHRHESGDTFHELIFRIRHASGDWHWLEHHCQPVVDADGTSLGRRASNRDVTDRVMLWQQLADAVASAEKAAQAKSEFLSNMSHEIRTPLNAVIGSAMLMLQDIHEPKQRKRLQRIASSSQQLLALINDILDLAKIEAGRIVIEKTDFELARLLDTVESQIEEKLHEKGLAWHIECDPAIPSRLNGDALRLGQILINFAINAVKFTERGEVRLSVWRIDRQADGLHLRFEMRDTGCGFDPAKTEAIFQPFEQEDGSTTRKHGGTGLGLAISRQLAQLMGGQVGARSQPGIGSTFWLEVILPEARDRAPAQRKAELKGKRAILIGDDAADIERIGQQLKNHGLFVQQVDTPLQLTTRVEVAARSGRPYDFMICVNQDAFCAQFMEPDLRARLATALTGPRTVHRLMACRIDTHDPEELQTYAGHFDAVLPLPVESSYLADLCRKLLAGETEETSRDGDAADAPPVDAATTDLFAYANRKLLLVEDNPINQDVMLDILGSAGLRADVADNGQEALAMVAARRYDLILMDMQMPVMGGIEATRAIRRFAAYVKTPILAMTANAFESDRQACLDAGMDDHIAKPVVPDILYAALRRWLPAPVHEPWRRSPAIPPAPTEEGEVFLPDMPGLDIATGLGYLRGKRALYRQLLERLAHDHIHDPVALRENIHSGNTVEARRIAHSLKGVAAMLGAEAIRALAAEIESHVKSADLPQAAVDMDSLLEQLAMALTDLKTVLA